MNRWRTSVEFRLVTFFLLLSWSSIALLAALTYGGAHRELTSSARTRLEVVTASKSEELNRWVLERRRHLRLLASVPEVLAAAAALAGPEGEQASAPICDRLRPFLATVRDEVPDVQEVLLLSAIGGRVTCSTERSHEGEYRARDEHFTQGRQGTHVQGVYPSPVTGQPLISIATPLLADRRPVGVLVAHLNLDYLDRVIVAPSGLGEHSEVYLVDRFNVFVSWQRYGRDQFPRGVHTAGIDAAVSGVTGSARYVDYRGVPVVGAYRWVPEMGVALIAEVQEREALAPSRRLAWTIVTVGFALATALALGVLALGRRITWPIVAITDVARSIAAGDLSRRAPVVTSDEIGSLAQAFNTMTDKLRQLYDELNTAAHRFATIFHSSPLAISVSTVDEGRIIDVNEAYLRMTGYQRDEVVGHTALGLGLWAHPEARATLRDQLRRGDEAHDLMLEVRTKSGEVRQWQGAAARIVLGTEPCAVGMFIDVTDRLAAARALRDRDEQLRQAQKMEALGRLAGGIAHDFNNLLTAILGYSQLLLEDFPPESTAYANADQIRIAGERAGVLSRRLLAFSRKEMLAPRVTDLNAVIGGMDAMLHRLIGEDIRVVLQLAPELGAVLADRGHLEQVIMNLAINARDAMPDGGTLTISTANSGPSVEDDPAGPREMVVLEVADTGVGMDAAMQARLFEPFFTTKPDGKGTGLGLATVHAIVQQNGGRIGVRSQPGAGTTFSVQLPRVRTPPDRDESDGLQRRPVGGHETILMAEDDPSVRLLVERVLRSHGYTVLAGASGEEALRLAAEYRGRIDLLLTDVVMTGMGGRQLVDAVARLWPGVRILYMSGYAGETVERHGVVSTGSVLPKPFQPPDLLLRVRMLLDTMAAGT